MSTHPKAPTDITEQIAELRDIYLRCIEGPHDGERIAVAEQTSTVEWTSSRTEAQASLREFEQQVEAWLSANAREGLAEEA